MFTLIIPFFHCFEACKDGSLKRKGFFRKCQSWPALGSRSNILQILVMESLAVQEAAVCPLHPADYVSHQRVKEPLFQEFKWGGTGGSAVNRPTSHFPRRAWLQKLCQHPVEAWMEAFPLLPKFTICGPLLQAQLVLPLECFFVAQWI